MSVNARAEMRNLHARYIEPALEPYGFVREGMSYRLSSGVGDSLIVEFQTSRSSGKDACKFFVNVGLVYAPWVAWIREMDEPAQLQDPKVTEALLRARVSRVQGPPLHEAANALHALMYSGGAESGLDDVDPQCWTIGPSHLSDRYGPGLTAQLLSTVHEFLPWLDREVCKQRLRSGDKLPAPQSPDVAMMVMLVDDGTSQELDGLIAEFKGNGSNFADWARGRAARADALKARSTRK
ncbi:DUF4304 domain-containing protein [Polymorphospora rubra]|uniref:DUF4304 domain-containing protein n=1 Tax=Polymorphospora rubra TaxID=338584 RepID=A0A810NBE6_9ACTN|nr:DUF4304 domain-containing protein [Polymorphospora rubra]BCJ70420.1 hypothetical protein Prubr_74410 [Polymorphospora rubra]